MKLIRFFLGLLIRFFDWLIPVGHRVHRTPEEQARVDRETSSMSIYQFVDCPFCVKTRRAVRRLGLKMRYRNVLADEQAKRELLQGGGEWQVPCLRITENGTDRWMYESGEIIQYLNSRFNPKEVSA